MALCIISAAKYVCMQTSPTTISGYFFCFCIGQLVLFAINSNIFNYHFLPLKVNFYTKNVNQSKAMRLILENVNLGTLN